MKLIKFITSSLNLSRRESEKLISNGEITVNGEIEINLIKEINESDTVKYKSKILRTLKKENIYILLNKPKGYVTTLKDEFNRKTILDLLPNMRERVLPVGRLDKDTTGLLLLTNDGDFLNRLTHPKNKIKKEYKVICKGFIKDADIKKLREGVNIFDANKEKRYKTKPATVSVIKIRKDSTEIKITISEGKNRQIRRMIESIGSRVIELKRLSYGGVYLGNLIDGTYRNLSNNEVKKLIGEKKS